MRTATRTLAAAWIFSACWLAPARPAHASVCFPEPWSEGGSPNLCSDANCPSYCSHGCTCRCEAGKAETCESLPVFPMPANLSFLGRYIESSGARDCQQSLRTLRAREVLIDAPGNRIYMALGSMVAAYDRSKFYSRLGAPLEPNLSNKCAAFEDGYYDLYLPPEAGSFYAESPGSGWHTYVIDGQERLYDIDTDGRGYIYIATSTFGWGVLRDEGRFGGIGLSSLVQVSPDVFSDHGTASGATSLHVVRVGEAWYALPSVDPGAGNSTDIFDVTDPSQPVLVRSLNRWLPEVASIPVPGGAHIATSWHYNNVAGPLEIYEGSSLLADGAPAVSIAAPAGTSWRSIVGVGARFYALRAGKTSAAVDTLEAADPAVASSYAIASSVALEPTDGSFDWHTLAASGGYLGVGALPAARLLRLQPDGALQQVPLGEYFLHYYNRPAPGYGVPDGYTALLAGLFADQLDGRHYLIFADHGLGDVYELTVPVEDDAGTQSDGGPGLDSGLQAEGGLQADGATCDAGHDAGWATSPGSGHDGGCGCRLEPRSSTQGGAGLLLALALLVRRRK